MKNYQQFVGLLKSNNIQINDITTPLDRATMKIFDLSRPVGFGSLLRRTLFILLYSNAALFLVGYCVANFLLDMNLIQILKKDSSIKEHSLYLLGYILMVMYHVYKEDKKWQNLGQLYHKLKSY